MPTADLTISMDDGTTTVAPGAATSYTIVVSNNGPDAVTGAAASRSAVPRTWRPVVTTTLPTA